MNPKELRIGNYVYEAPIMKPIIIESVSETGINYLAGDAGDAPAIYPSVSIGGINPIPLTTEWLEKLGFIGKGNDHALIIPKETKEYIIRVYPLISGNPGCFYRVYDLTERGVVEKHLKYVHQLQNLHFDLTGEFLEIKT